MWRDYIDVVKEQLQEINELLNIGCEKEIILDFKDEVINIFNYALPNQYLEFLLEINGLEYNGLIIYGIDDYITNMKNNQEVSGYIDQNQTWNYDENEEIKFMYLGDSDISWYCYDIKNEKFVELDKPSSDIVDTFESFYDMLDSALELII